MLGTDAEIIMSQSFSFIL